MGVALLLRVGPWSSGHHSPRRTSLRFGQGNIMSDAALLLLVESRKKSGWLAALLNLFLPGAGYIYCGRWILGIFAFFFIVALVLVSFGLGAIPVALLLVIDGFLCAGRYNRKLIEQILKDQAAGTTATAAA